jgi:quercetin dioxygenase-like cupin family protein
MAEVLRLTPQESVAIRSSTLEAFEVEGTWGPRGEPPPAHFHPAQDERFEVLAGALRARVDEQEHELTVGDVLEIPRDAVHQMWNEGDEPARAVWRTTPGGRTREWFAALDELQRSGRVDRKGLPSPLAFGALLRTYPDVIRLAGPRWLTGPAVWLIGTAGRLRGYASPG